MVTSHASARLTASDYDKPYYLQHKEMHKYVCAYMSTCLVECHATLHVVRAKESNQHTILANLEFRGRTRKLA